MAGYHEDPPFGNIVIVSYRLENCRIGFSFGWWFFHRNSQMLLINLFQTEELTGWFGINVESHMGSLFLHPNSKTDNDKYERPKQIKTNEMQLIHQENNTQNYKNERQCAAGIAGRAVGRNILGE